MMMSMIKFDDYDCGDKYDNDDEYDGISHDNNLDSNDSEKETQSF